MRVRIGTRGSKLALAQSYMVQSALSRACPEAEFETVVISTAGDRQAADGDLPAGTGVFVKEIEEKLLGGEIDLAVHSLKDMPVSPPAGLILAAVLVREDAREAFVSRDGRTLAELPSGARVGTGSPRRRAQLLRFRPDLSLIPIRGNVDTRLRKVREGLADGTVLALAGLRRLGLEESVTEIIPLDKCLPAPGQGAVVCQVRTGEAVLIELAGRINHEASARAVRAERAFLQGLGGGCRAPIAAYASEETGILKLSGLAGDADGRRFVEGALCGPPADAAGLGDRLARELLARGAGELPAP